MNNFASYSKKYFKFIPITIILFICSLIIMPVYRYYELRQAVSIALENNISVDAGAYTFEEVVYAQLFDNKGYSFKFKEKIPRTEYQCLIVEVSYGNRFPLPFFEDPLFQEDFAIQVVRSPSGVDAKVLGSSRANTPFQEC